MMKIYLVIYVNYLFLILKICVIYLSVIIILRILGKREVGELSIFDLVILLIIADIASIGIDNTEFFIPGLVCLVTLAVLQKIFSYILLKFARLRGVCDGNPTIIIYNGIINIKNMSNELYTFEDLVSQMRMEHIMDISEIKLAILETNGTLSVMKNDSHQELCLPIILSGLYVKENLAVINIKKDKISKALSKNNLDIKKIMYASYQNGVLRYYYRKNKRLKELKESKLML